MGVFFVASCTCLQSMIASCPICLSTSIYTTYMPDRRRQHDTFGFWNPLWDTAAMTPDRKAHLLVHSIWTQNLATNKAASISFYRARFSWPRQPLCNTHRQRVGTDWNIWKERNRRIFNNEAETTLQVVVIIKEDIQHRKRSFTYV